MAPPNLYVIITLLFQRYVSLLTKHTVKNFIRGNTEETLINLYLVDIPYTCGKCPRGLMKPKVFP